MKKFTLVSAFTLGLLVVASALLFSSLSGVRNASAQTGLTVTLAPSVPSGQGSVTTNLTAAIGNGSGWTIYHFWRDCNNTTDLSTTACGGQTAEFGSSNQSFVWGNNPPTNPPVTYGAPGTYHPRVVIDQGANRVAAVSTVTVTTGGGTAPSCALTWYGRTGAGGRGLRKVGEYSDVTIDIKNLTPNSSPALQNVGPTIVAANVTADANGSIFLDHSQTLIRDTEYKPGDYTTKVVTSDKGTIICTPNPSFTIESSATPSCSLTWNAPTGADGRGLRHLGENSNYSINVSNLAPNSVAQIKNSGPTTAFVQINADGSGNYSAANVTTPISGTEYTVGVYTSSLITSAGQTIACTPAPSFEIQTIASGLTVTLTPSVPSGQGSVTTNLTAAIGNGSGWTIYHFWRDCNNTTDSSTTACGGQTAEFGSSNQSFVWGNNPPTNPPVTYGAPGTYHPRVVIDQGANRVAAVSTVTVTTGTGATPSCTLTWAAPIGTGGAGLRKVGEYSNVKVDIKNLTPNSAAALQNIKEGGGNAVAANFTADGNGNYYVDNDATLIRAAEYAVGNYRTQLVTPDKGTVTCTPDPVSVTILPSAAPSCALTWNAPTGADGRGLRHLGENSNYSINVANMASNSVAQIKNSGPTTVFVSFTADGSGNYSAANVTTPISAVEYAVGDYRSDIITSAGQIIACTPTQVSFTIQAAGPAGPKVGLSEQYTSMTAAAVPPKHTFSVTNAGSAGSSMNWQIVPKGIPTLPDWLIVSPVSGINLQKDGMAPVEIAPDAKKAFIGLNTGIFNVACLNADCQDAAAGTKILEYRVDFTVPAPTVTLTADKVNVTQGGTVTFSGSSANAGSLDTGNTTPVFSSKAANSSWTAAVSFPDVGSYVYKYGVKGLSQVDGSANNFASQSVVITVNAPTPDPVISVAVTPVPPRVNKDPVNEVYGDFGIQIQRASCNCDVDLTLTPAANALNAGLSACFENQCGPPRYQITKRSNYPGGSGLSTVSLRVFATKDVPAGTYSFNLNAKAVGTTAASAEKNVPVNFILDPPPVNPDFVLNVTPLAQSVIAAAGSAPADYTVSVTRQGNYAGRINLAASLIDPSGSVVQLSWPQNLYVDPPPAPQFVLLRAAPGMYTSSQRNTIAVTGSGTGVPSHSQNVYLDASPQPDFQITVNPATNNITQGRPTTFTVDVARLANFSDNINLSLTVPSPLPTGVTAQLSKSAITAADQDANKHTVLTLAVGTGATTPTGRIYFFVNAVGANGWPTHGAGFELYVDPPGSVNVSLDAVPSSGTGTFSSTVTATVGGTMTGPIHYLFWQNCSNQSTVSSTVVAACGSFDRDWGFETATQKATSYTYSQSGTAKVLVERGGAWAEARKSVTVGTVLTAAFNANPASGQSPLTSVLTATPSGAANGEYLSYYFWKDCAYGDPNVVTPIATLRQSQNCGTENHSKGMSYAGAPYSWTPPAYTAGATARVLVNRGNDWADARAAVSVSAGTLSVSLAGTAPTSGQAPLTVTPQAAVTGGSGFITYYFWKDCTYAGISTSTARSQCVSTGGNYAEFGSNNATVAWSPTPLPYNQNGTAKVIVQDGLGRSAEARQAITVTVPQTFTLASNPPSASLRVGQMQTFAITAQGNQGKAVTLTESWRDNTTLDLTAEFVPNPITTTASNLTVLARGVPSPNPGVIPITGNVAGFQPATLNIPVTVIPNVGGQFDIIPRYLRVLKGTVATFQAVDGNGNDVSASGLFTLDDAMIGGASAAFAPRVGTTGLNFYGLAACPDPNAYCANWTVSYPGSGSSLTVHISVIDPRAPTATTTPATAIGTTSATLNGIVNPQWGDTSYRFDYGVTGVSSAQTTLTPITPTNASDHVVNAAVSGLTPNTTYWFRVYARNPLGETTGQTLNFTTVRPSVTLNAPVSATVNTPFAVSWTSQNVTAVVLPSSIMPPDLNMPAGNCNFTAPGTRTDSVRSGDLNSSPGVRYVTCTRVGRPRLQITVADASNNQDTAYKDVDITPIGALSCNPSGQCVAGGGGASCTSNAQCTGGGTHLECVSNACQSVTGVGPNLHGCTAVGQSCSGGGTHLECVSNQCVSRVGVGPNLGGCTVLNTSCGILVPLATTTDATAVTTTMATLNGLVNPRGAATDYRFEYGTTYDSVWMSTAANKTTFTSAGSGGAERAVNASVAGLTPGTSYYFRIFAQNSFGNKAGAVNNLSTAVIVTPLGCDPATNRCVVGGTGRSCTTLGFAPECVPAPVCTSFAGSPSRLLIPPPRPTSTLSWICQNATTCNISTAAPNRIRPIANGLAGSSYVVTATSTTTYGLTCTNTGGTSPEITTKVRVFKNGGTTECPPDVGCL